MVEREGRGGEEDMNREGRGGVHEQGGGGEGHEQGKEENMDGQRLSLVTSPLEQVHCPPNREGVAL